jgi:LysR substrate binding domain
MMTVFRERLVVIAPKEITAIKKPGDIRGMTVIAFGVGCSYRRTLEEWLARSNITPQRVLEFGSYHAIVACVAAGSGIAVIPHSVVHALHAEREVSILPLPTEFTDATTFLVWARKGTFTLNQYTITASQGNAPPLRPATENGAKLPHGERFSQHINRPASLLLADHEADCVNCRWLGAL